MAKKPIIVGLDIGSNFGYAVLMGRRRLASGTWRLWCAAKDKKKGTHQGYRWKRLYDALSQLLRKWCKSSKGEKIHVVVEDVRRHVGTTAAHVYGGLLAIVDMVILSLGAEKFEYSLLGVSSWKRITTGKGNASKQEYVDAVNQIFRLQLNVSKNEDEAAALGVAAAYTNKIEKRS